MSVVDIPSIPATFVVGDFRPIVGLAFAIPSGFVVASATLTIAPLPIVPHRSVTINMPGGGVFYDNTTPATQPVPVPNIAFINAAAGGLWNPLTLNADGGGPGTTVNSLILELTGVLAVDHCGITPLLQSTIEGTPTGDYTITLYDGAGMPIVAPVGGQTFILTDGDDGIFLIP